MKAKTVTPEAYLKTPITRPDGIYCRRCNRRLGEIDPDGQYLEAGNIRLFGRYQKYFCLCGSAYNFSERDLGGGHSIRDFGNKVTREILNELGKEYNEQYLREKHKKRNHDDEEESDD